MSRLVVVSNRVALPGENRAGGLAVALEAALQESGGLWFAYSQGKIAKFGASQLAASGSVAPEVIVTSSSIGSATGPALYPAPKALPLYAAVQN